MLVVSAVGIVGCGGSTSPRQVAARVGGDPITQVAFEHWLSVMAPRHVAPVPPTYSACIAHEKKIAPQSAMAQLREECRDQYREVAQKVLGLLISARWLTGEAAEQGVKVSPDEVAERLEQKRKSYASAAEFGESLKAIAHTRADVRVELEAELAREKLLGKLAADEPTISTAAVAAYYDAHARQYHIPEERYFDIGENFRSAALARKAMREADAGHRLAQSLHEKLPRKPYTDYNGEKRTIYEAIFKAKPNVITGPIDLNGYYFVIDVTRVAPPYVQELPQVREAIAKQLAAEQHKRTLAAFVAAWRSKWTARTDCAPVYVVPGCRQYTGTKLPEEPFPLN
jgi:hypothetical protein